VPGSQYVMSLGATGVSKRRWSWLLGLGVLLVFILIPMVGVFNGGVNKILRNTPLPSDSLWLTGPLLSAHHIPEIGNNCNVCHVSLFKMVPNKPCVKCHKNVGHHVDYKKFDIAELKNRRCGSCHKEHNEPEMMVRRDQKLCADCHQHIASVVDSSKLDIKDAGDFLSNHPDFRISLLQPEKTGDITQWKTVRKTYPNHSLKEQSNLKFSHKVHLDAKGIDSPDGNKVLVCADCHQPDSSGRKMLPIVMEKHCRNCHSLAFDEADPDREVPHGDPDKVIIALEEYYSRLYLKGEVEEVTTTSGRRRTVHRHRTGETGVNNSDALIKAKRMAQNAGEQLFGHILVDGACKTCHFISISNNAKFLSKWRVEPVLLEQTWMPNASFDHGSHRKEPCGDCHKAKDSEKSSDILLPGIRTCRKCHGGEKDNNMVATTCIDCHKFHVPDNVSHDKKEAINVDARHLHQSRTQVISTLN
jgi:predicted CXXCH cytochrome family protein